MCIRLYWSLGPNFSLSPRVDEKLLCEVKTNMAACAYQLRWVKHTESVSTCATRAQYLKQQCAPVTRSYVHPPPTDNTEVEDKLKQMNSFVLHLYESSVVPFNLTNVEAAGLKSLREKKNMLHFSVSDKGGEFVVMEKESQHGLTVHHISSTAGVYQYIPPSRLFHGAVRDIAAPTPA